LATFTAAIFWTAVVSLATVVLAGAEQMRRSEVREIDRIAIERFGMSGLVLMENAGRGAADRIARVLPDGCGVCILCGTGNNAGDGYVIARHLELLGFRPRIVSLVPLEKLSGDAEANAKIAAKSGIPITVVATAEEIDGLIRDQDCVLDCMLGTGAVGNPRGLFRDAVQVANRKSGPRVAIDLPTGLDCDSGQPAEATFRADLTVTFVAEKDGFACESAKPFLGNVEVVGIGVPLSLLQQFQSSAADILADRIK
jgi:NAD(P)H-hydrate epimerase